MVMDLEVMDAETGAACRGRRTTECQSPLHAGMLVTSADTDMDPVADFERIVPNIRVCHLPLTVTVTVIYPWAILIKSTTHQHEQV